MKTRKTARLLLFDQTNRLLLMKVDDPAVSDPTKPWLKSPFWVTLGGKIEEEETVILAAQRELFEETGLKEAEIGPAVWYGEHILLWGGEEILLKETFVVIRTTDTKISDEHLEAAERKVIVEMKWWTIDDLANTDEIILPLCLQQLIGPISTGNYPQSIDWINL